MRFLVAGALLMACTGCQAALIAGVSTGFNILGEAVGLHASLENEIRNATGGCITWYFKTVPCPPLPQPVKP